MTPDELMFFDKMPSMLPLYEVLRTKLTEKYPDISVKVSKTRISFKNKYIFAMSK